MQSDTWALASPDARPWLLMLWTVAWQQTPCGSMPSNHELIAARLGIKLKDFQRIKEVLLRGWWQAVDGRLYHETITSRVLDMVARKDGERARKAAYRAKKEAERQHGDNAGVPPPSEDVPQLSRGTDTGQTRESHGSDATGTGTGTGTGLISKEEDYLYPPMDEAEGPSPFGAACLAMKAVGLPDTSPGNPKLRALVQAGATVEEFVDAARKALSAKAGFSYALTVVENSRKAAAAMASQLHNGALPASETAYQRSMRERMAEVAPDFARKAPGQPAQNATEFFNAIDVTARTVELLK